VYSGLEDAHEQLVDVYDEMEGQLDKEVSRVAELVQKMVEDPGKHIFRGLRIAELIRLTHRIVLHDRK
jgi:hypothetical protein